MNIRMITSLEPKARVSNHILIRKVAMMKAKGGLLAAVVVCALLSACATSGTRVNTTSDTYRQLARSQQAWCAQFGCNCYLDGVQTSCSLVAACLNSGNCQRVQ